MSRTVTVDVDLEQIDTETLVDELREREVPLVAAPPVNVERLYYATRSDHWTDDVKRQAADLIANAYGRLA